jgi:hypothetical protein
VNTLSSDSEPVPSSLSISITSGVTGGMSESEVVDNDYLQQMSRVWLCWCWSSDEHRRPRS